MKIERLILTDFKSFGGRVEVAFPPGVAVIIGPNGSGKSNLVDALRWVFGEAESVVLRAPSPADLVFRGESGQAAAICSVTAVLRGPGGERDDGFPLVVSRRARADGRESYAVGEERLERSEYLEFLRRHGVAAPLPTVIGQGEVGRLLWLHPAERTQLLVQTVLAQNGGAGAPDQESARIAAAAQAARAEVEHVAVRCAELSEQIARAERDAQLRRRLDEERAGLLAACAPRGDDPLLQATLVALGLPAWRDGDFSLRRRGVSWERALRRAESLAADLDGSWADLYTLQQEERLWRKRLSEGREELFRLEQAAGRQARAEAAAREERRQAFLALHARVEERFGAFFRMLTPGGDAILPLVSGGVGEGLPGFEVAVRFPGKPAVPLDGLSGGQLALVGLCLALAVFLEVSSPALVLDEVEPALDEALLRRLTRLFADIAGERQIIAVSHQRLMRNTAHHVLQLKRRTAGSFVEFQYDPRTLRAPGAPRR